VLADVKASTPAARSLLDPACALPAVLSAGSAPRNGPSVSPRNALKEKREDQPRSARDLPQRHSNSVIRKRLKRGALPAQAQGVPDRAASAHVRSAACQMRGAVSMSKLFDGNPPGNRSRYVMFLDVFSSRNLLRRIFVSAETEGLAGRPTECAHSKWCATKIGTKVAGAR
jgi:hypothetical protein